MLPRGDQRAMVALSLFLILSIILRIVVQIMPGREPAGLDDFIKESQEIFAALAIADSLESVNRHDASSEATESGTHFQSPQSPPSRHASTITAHQIPISINTSDSSQLLVLPGIGPVFASRIIKYRNLLGGFVSVEQLIEVYGLKEETIRQVRDLILIDTFEIRKMDINQAAFGDLLRHPYLDLNDVKSILKYRDFKGHFNSLHEIEQNHLLSDSTLNKVKPYLQIIL